MNYILRFIIFCMPVSLIAKQDLLSMAKEDLPSVFVLGVCQDGGRPHAGCRKLCCQRARSSDFNRNFIVSLAVVDREANEWWLIEATPDVGHQIHLFHEMTNGQFPYLPKAIVITHAHIGHYAGLMQFGREVMNTKDLPVYVLPKMQFFLENNGPWSQLVQLANVKLLVAKPNQSIILSNSVSIEPFLVPHRDEFSETAGFKIITSGKTYLFIPDIDKWEKWDRSIVDEVKKVNIAFIDATFYHESELTNRSIEEIPHPLVLETVKLFENENAIEKSKIKFIHMNHTNPLLWSEDVRNHIQSKGFGIAVQGQWY